MLLLIKGSHCPLCDHAEAALQEAGFESVEHRYVEDDRELKRRYGLRIPVVVDTVTGAELGWPFDAARLHQEFGAPT